MGKLEFVQGVGTTDTPTMQLIGVGRCAAKPAEYLEVGDVITWNYGHRYEVVSIAPAGKLSIRIVERALSNGKEFTRVLRLNRLVVA